ncbi:hypothetical protein [Burkholderia sp. RF2-non_BP3]|uniref:hypothetical protein n=1 Tax=Burkholderia sp. RF2-non_BP3 TaxID=1637844 RepID=UPI0012E3F72F|nr:hypothetical protein [Burkholderia sp. RF2-non_BP3]
MASGRGDPTNGGRESADRAAAHQQRCFRRFIASWNIDAMRLAKRFPWLVIWPRMPCPMGDRMKLRDADDLRERASVDNGTLLANPTCIRARLSPPRSPPFVFSFDQDLS